MGTPARRDDILRQIRALSVEDRDFIEAALMREAYEQGRRSESQDELAEIVRATDAVAHRDRGFSREESVARAQAAVATRAQSVKGFRVEPIAQSEFEEAAAGTRANRMDSVAEVDRVLARISYEHAFATAPIATVPGAEIRREFVDRFPYVVVFVESSDLRKVVMIRRGSSSPEQWQSRL